MRSVVNRIFQLPPFQESPKHQRQGYSLPRMFQSNKMNDAWVLELSIPDHLCSAAAAAKLLQLCPTLCDPIDGSPPGSPISGILQARILEWVAISFSNAWKWKVKVKSLSRVQLFTTPWTAAYQAPPSMGFSRQEYWSGVPLPSLGHPLIWPRVFQSCITIKDFFSHFIIF